MDESKPHLNAMPFKMAGYLDKISSVPHTTATQTLEEKTAEMVGK